MTKVQMRFRLERPLDEQAMSRISLAHAIYGIMRVQVVSPTEEIVVDYDASRLGREDVEAALKRSGITVELEK